MSNTRLVKVQCLVCGSSSVGKTTLLQRLSQSGVPEEYLMSTRVAIHRKSYAVTESNTQLEVLYIEFPGKSFYQSLLLEMAKQFENNCLVLAMFDVTNRSSLATVENLLQLLPRQSNKKTNNLPGILVANKIDLVDKKIISNNEGQQKSKILKYRYFECSALNDLSLQALEMLIVETIKSNLVSKSDRDTLPKMN